MKEAEVLTASRSVRFVTTAVRTLEGAGFAVRRPFPTRGLSEADPFLLLDEMGPQDVAPGEAKGAPDHPHRGFETVTYMLEGRMAAWSIATPWATRGPSARATFSG